MFRFNDVEDLVNGILLLISDNGLMRKLGMSVRYELETKYSWNNALKIKVREVLNKVMSN